MTELEHDENERNAPELVSVQNESRNDDFVMDEDFQFNEIPQGKKSIVSPKSSLCDFDEQADERHGREPVSTPFENIIHAENVRRSAKTSNQSSEKEYKNIFQITPQQQQSRNDVSNFVTFSKDPISKQPIPRKRNRVAP